MVLSRACISSISSTNKSTFSKEWIYFWCICWSIESFRHGWPSNFTKKEKEYYGIAGNSLRWFENYLNDRKHFISFEHNSTKKATATCCVHQGSILGPSLFLLYLNDLHHALTLLNPIIFADDTNLFFSHSYINVLFKKMNKELTNVNDWFNDNKLSLYIKKTKYSFSQKSSKNIIFCCGFRI